MQSLCVESYSIPHAASVYRLEELVRIFIVEELGARVISKVLTAGAENEYASSELIVEFDGERFALRVSIRRPCH